MADACESFAEDGAASLEATPLEDIEQDLDTVDEALAALDTGDLETAEALAAALGSPSDDQAGDDQGPASGLEAERIDTSPHATPQTAERGRGPSGP